MPIAPDVILAPGAQVLYPELVNLYGCRIGSDTKIGPFVEIQKNVVVGSRCKISSHSFLCEGVTVEDEVFVGHGVIFVNDRFPRAAHNGRLLADGDWTPSPVTVRRGASIGSAAVVLAGVTIGERAMIGAGAVVTSDVEPETVVAGIPARLLRHLADQGKSNARPVS